MKELPVIHHISCFAFHEGAGTACPRKDCRHWISSPEHLNCSIIGASEGKMTLREIGKIFGITRMRICQIEKEALKKLSKALLGHQD